MARFWGGGAGASDEESGEGEAAAPSAHSVSTVFISGFASNANDRELENFCRFMPGFVGAKAFFSLAGPRVFVRFDCHEMALNAVQWLNGTQFDPRDGRVILRASMAKSDTNPVPHSVPRQGGVQCIRGSLDTVLALDCTSTPGPTEFGVQGAVVAPPSSSGWKTSRHLRGLERDSLDVADVADLKSCTTPTTPPSGTVVVVSSNFTARAQKRGWEEVATPSSESRTEKNDTLCILGVVEKGLTEKVLADFFEGLPGFVALRIAPGLKGSGNAFVKFISAELATGAIEAAHVHGLEAQFARTSLNVNTAAFRAAATGAGHDMSGESDTLCIMAVGDKGLTEPILVEFYVEVPGFVGLRYSSSGKGGGNCFVKFASCSEAVEALHFSRSQGIESEMARTSLNPLQATFRV